MNTSKKFTSKVYVAAALAASTLLLLSCSTNLPSSTPSTEISKAPLPQDKETGLMAGMTQVHNRIRARLGIPPLRWSNRLAAIARNRAMDLAMNNNCTMRHTMSELGENLFWASPVKWSDGRREPQKITAPQVAEAWAAEASDYDYSTNSCTTGAMCGHYTQMIWKDSKELGCGMAICPDKAQIWVCVYYPPGNYVGLRPY